MLQVKISMNSSTGEVLAFKTCCGLQVFDQNLEILVTNQGPQPVVLLSEMDLVLDNETRRIRNLMPSGEQSIGPGEVKAFYCQMDEELWQRARELILLGVSGQAYRTGLVDPR